LKHQEHVPQFMGFAICADLLSFLLLGNALAAGPEAPVPGTAVTEDAAARVKWRTSIGRLPVPNRNSCFKATFPKTEWQQIPCKPAPERPYVPVQRRQPADIGGKNYDVAAQVPEQIQQISTAIGSFGSGTIATSETGTTYAPGTCTVKAQEPDTFSLQLNTNNFPIPVSSPICGGAAGCEGFQQFVYSSHDNVIAISYWLINVGKYGTASCPGAEWHQYNHNGTLWCWQNTKGTPLEYPVSIGDLYNLTLQGTAAANGDDTVMLTTSRGLPYEVYHASNPDILGLGQNWQDAEFNVFGDGCGSEAKFKGSATLTVVLSVDYGPAEFAAGYMPLACTKGKYTQEWNNLGFSGPAQTASTTAGNGYPTLYFTEVLGASAGASCAAPSSPPTPPPTGGGPGSDQCMRNGLIVPCATCDFLNQPSPRDCVPCATHCNLPQ
jgi:hypothetical protein